MIKRWFRLQHIRQSFESKIKTFSLLDIVILCCFIHDQLILRFRNSSAITKHHISSTCSFNWNLTCAIRVMLEVDASSIKRNRIDLTSAIVKSWWYFANFVLIKFNAEISIFVIKKTLQTSLRVCTWQSNCSCWFCTTSKSTTLKCIDDILTITRREAMSLFFSWFIRFCVFLKSFWIRFSSRIANFSTHRRFRNRRLLFSRFRNLRR